MRLTCLLLLLLMCVFGAAAGPSHRVRNLAYVPAQDSAYDAERHRLDVYYPRRAAAVARPVVVFIHGGAWDSGNKNLYWFVGRRLAKQGVVAVVVNYRLAPRVRVPQMATDCARALVWVRRHIGQYGGDSTRLFVMGHSAGGGLAALLATGDSLFARYGLPRPPVRGAILDDAAGLDMYSYLRRMASPDDRQYLIPFGTDPAGWRNASPLYHLRAGAPPFLLFVGGRTYPAIRTGSEELQRRARASGTAAALTVIPHRKHIPMVLQLFWKRNVIYRQLLPFVGASS